MEKVEILRDDMVKTEMSQASLLPFSQTGNSDQMLQKIAINNKRMRTQAIVETEHRILENIQVFRKAIYIQDTRPEEIYLRAKQSLNHQ